MTTTTDAIRRLNDLARRQPSRANASWVFTQGVAALLISGEDADPLNSETTRLSLLRSALASFHDWPKGNDPHGEHDFGAFTLFGERLFFQIAYYDLALEAFSPDPSSIAQCRRVLTIMLAGEY